MKRRNLFICVFIFFNLILSGMNAIAENADVSIKNTGYNNETQKLIKYLEDLKIKESKYYKSPTSPGNYPKLREHWDDEFNFYLKEYSSPYFLPTKDDEKKNLSDLSKCLEAIRNNPNIQLSPENKKYLRYLEAESFYKQKKYTEAYQSYFLLKSCLNSKDSIYSTVNKRLRSASIHKNINDIETNLSKRPLELLSKLELKVKQDLFIQLFLIFLFSIFLILVVVFIKLDQKFKAGENGGKILLETKIISEKDKPISLEKMRQQDGRASSSAVQTYEKIRRGEPSEINDKRIIRYARLIYESHKMIEEVNRYAPYPVAVVAKCIACMSKGSQNEEKLPHFWQYTLFGFVFIGIWKLLPICPIFATDTSNVVLFLIAGFVISCLTGIRIMAIKTISSLDELVSMMEAGSDDKNKIVFVPQSVKDLEAWIINLFRSPWQFFICLLIYSIVIFILYILDELGIEGSFNIDCVFYIPLVMMSSSLIWLILGSLVTLNKICNMKDLAINPLSPLKTMGLEKWISVIGSYNIIGSIVLTFGCCIALVQAHLSYDTTLYGWFWFVLIMPMLIFYWIYPYQKLGNLVKSIKVKRMHFIKTRISQIFNMWVKFEEKILEEEEKEGTLDRENARELPRKRGKMLKEIEPQLKDMNDYFDMFKKIDESPESYLDFYSAMELVKVMGLPSLFAIISAFWSMYF